MAFDSMALLLGALAGFVVSGLYFAGLAIGVRAALRRSNPVGLLVLSAVVRMAALIGAGWGMVMLGGLWAALGFAVAFFVARFIATRLAWAGVPADVSAGDAP